VHPRHKPRRLGIVAGIVGTMAILGAARSGAPPGARRPGAWSIGLDLEPVPSIDYQVGTKQEPVNPPPLVARARASWSVGGGFSLGALVLPATRVGSYLADTMGAEIDYGVSLGAFRASLRGFTVQGTVQGPLSETTTSDTFKFRNQGADARAGWALNRWIFYAGAGSGFSRTSLDVASDGSQSAFASPYGFAFLGLSRDAGSWRFTIEQHQTESYLSHVVITVSHVY